MCTVAILAQGTQRDLLLAVRFLCLLSFIGIRKFPKLRKSRHFIPVFPGSGKVPEMIGFSGAGRTFSRPEPVGATLAKSPGFSRISGRGTIFSGLCEFVDKCPHFSRISANSQSRENLDTFSHFSEGRQEAQKWPDPRGLGELFRARNQSAATSAKSPGFSRILGRGAIFSGLCEIVDKCPHFSRISANSQSLENLDSFSHFSEGGEPNQK
jgi:hypothetical protein